MRQFSLGKKQKRNAVNCRLMEGVVTFYGKKANTLLILIISNYFRRQFLPGLENDNIRRDANFHRV